ncbi:MAG: hypothetical protein ACO378_03985 [Sedimenticolaceae bacterium]
MVSAFFIRRAWRVNWLSAHYPFLVFLLCSVAHLNLHVADRHSVVPQ